MYIDAMEPGVIPRVHGRRYRFCGCPGAQAREEMERHAAWLQQQLDEARAARLSSAVQQQPDGEDGAALASQLHQAQQELGLSSELAASLQRQLDEQQQVVMKLRNQQQQGAGQEEAGQGAAGEDARQELAAAQAAAAEASAERDHAKAQLARYCAPQCHPPVARPGYAASPIWGG